MMLAAMSVNAETPMRATTTILPNGLKVITYEDHSTSLVAVDIWVKAGSVNETEHCNGVAHFIEHLLFKSTDKRGPGQVDMEIETLGASLDAKTSRDWAHFSTVVDRRYLDKAIEIMADVVSHPKFRQEDIDQERSIILDEIARGESSPFKSLRDTVFQTAFSAHPYRFPVEGTPASVKKITKDMISDYYSRLYVPGNMSVVLVGDITDAEAAVAVKKAFADINAKPATVPTIAKDPVTGKTLRQTVKRNTRLAYIAVAFPAPSVKEKPDVYAMDVLTSYLGVGYQSWLESELKDTQRLAIETSCDFLTQRYTGLAILMASTEPNNVQRAEDAMLAKVAELKKTPLNNYALSRAKRALEGGHAFDIETLAGRATNIGFYDAIDSADSSQDYVMNIEKVTSDDVLAVARKYFDTNRAVIVVLGP